MKATCSNTIHQPKSNESRPIRLEHILGLVPKPGNLKLGHLKEESDEQSQFLLFFFVKN